MTKSVAFPKLTRDAMVMPDSLDADANTIEVCFSTGARGPRRGYVDGDYQNYEEELQVDSTSIRTDRLNAGAPFLDSHDDWSLSSVLGSVVPGSVRIAGGKAYARVQLSRAPDKAGTVQDIKDKIIRNISVGYRVHQASIEKRQDQVPLMRVTDWEPMELSAVPIPFDTGAQVRNADQQQLFDCVITNQRSQTMANENDTGAGSGSGTETTTRAAAPATVAAAVASLSEADVTSIASRAVAAERERAVAVDGLCRKFGMDDAFRATVAGKSEAEVRAAILDKLAERNAAGPAAAGHTTVTVDGRDRFREGVTEGLLARTAHKDGKRNEFSGLSLREIAREALRASNLSTSFSDPMQMAGVALGLMTREGGMESTSDFTYILANVAHKFMLKGYEEAGETFQQWTSKGTLTDFKPTKRVDLNLFPALLAIPEGAEYKYGSIGDRGTTVTLATYGRKFAITRQAIINDDLSVFTRIPQRMGQAAIRTIGNLAYAVLTANANLADGIALFHASHANLAGSGGAPSVTTLDAARVAMAKQQDPDANANALNIRPSWFLVPKELEGTATMLMRSEFNPAQTQRVPNIVAGMAQVVSDARLSANSATAWYLAGDPGVYDTIEVSYLNGVEAPTLEQQLGWDVDGREFKIRIDAAVTALDFRALYKNGG